MKIRNLISLTVGVILCCILFTAAAYAEGPINPYFDKARSMKIGQRLRETYALTVELSVPENIRTGQEVTFTAQAAGGSGNYSYLFEVASYDTDFENWLKADLMQNEYGESNTLQFTFWAPDNYYVRVEAIDNEDNTKKGNSMPDGYPNSGNVTVTGEDLLAARVVQIVSECPSGDSFERALWLHDYLVNNAEYDYGYNYYTAGGLLMLGTAVCDGYSRAYNLLLEQAGIGHARVESEGHAWNAVELAEGEWYHVDTTWDDPGGNANPEYDFFGLPTEIISRIRSHVPDYSRDCYFPDCIAYGSNYYIKTDRMKWHNSVIDEIENELNADERDFSLSLSGRYSYNGNTYGITYPVIYYGLSQHLLQQDGLEYRNRKMDLLADGYDFDNPLILPIEAHYPLNEIDPVMNLPTNLGVLEQQSLQSTAAVVVVIPDGCEEIASQALADISSLDEVHIPASVTEIATDAFSNCKSNLLIVTSKNSVAAAFADDKGFCVEFIAD